MSNFSRKQYPISDLKLKKLRDSGIVPFSRDFQTIAISIGVGIGVYLVFLFLGEESEILQKCFKVKNINEFKLLIESFSSFFIMLILRATFPVFFLVLLFGWYQSGFLVTFRAFKFLNFTNMFTPFSNLFFGFKERFFLAFLSLSKFLLFSLVSFGVLLYSYSNKITDLSLFTHFRTLWTGNFEDYEFFFKNLMVIKSVFINVCVLVLTFSVFVGILSRIFSVIMYNLSYMMTREEVEEEDREMEHSDEIKKAFSNASYED